MRIRSIDIQIDERVIHVQGGQSRETLIEQLGPPDDIGGQTKKRPRGQILLYGVVEFHLDQDDCLILVFSDTVDGDTNLCVNFTDAIEKKH